MGILSVCTAHTDTGNVSKSFVVREHTRGERVNNELCLTVLHFSDQRTKTE